MARAPATLRNPRARARGHYVYLAQAADGAFYCGYAVDPIARVAVHNAGQGSKSLRGRRPVRLVYVRRFAELRSALRHEIALKKRSHDDKARLVRDWQRRAARKGRLSAPE